MKLRTIFAMLPVFLITTIANGQMISVNFHVGDDVEGQDSHIFDGTETAGLADFNTAAWNNVAVGNANCWDCGGSQHLSRKGVRRFH